MSDLRTALATRHPSTRAVAQWLVPNPSLPSGLPARVSRLFADTAAQLLTHVPDDSPELTAALRHLLQSKDAAVRAAMGSNPAATPPPTLSAEDRARIAACPNRAYHDTHRYCPSCPWTEDAPA